MNSTTQPWETPRFGRGWGLIGTGEERTRGWGGVGRERNYREMETAPALPAGLFEAVTVKPWKKDDCCCRGRGKTKGVVTRRRWFVNLNHTLHVHTRARTHSFQQWSVRDSGGKLDYFTELSRTNFGQQRLGTIHPALISVCTEEGQVVTSRSSLLNDPLFFWFPLHLHYGLDTSARAQNFRLFQHATFKCVFCLWWVNTISNCHNILAEQPSHST